MIKYEWRDHLGTDEMAEVAELLWRAAEYDAEPEYPIIAMADVERAMRQPSRAVQHLIIWMLPQGVVPEQPECIAGVIRLTFGSANAAELVVVIDPRYRSIGIATLLLEQVGLAVDRPDGWLGTGARHITCWARGNHPAAGRLSNRFLIPRTRRVWKLIRSTGSGQDVTAAPVLESAGEALLGEFDWAAQLPRGGRWLALREHGRILGAVALDLRPAASPEFGACATIADVGLAPHADVDSRKRLVEGAAAIAHESGMSGVIVYVDSDDAALVNACRLTGFQHDRTDVRYELGGG